MKETEKTVDAREGERMREGDGRNIDGNIFYVT